MSELRQRTPRRHIRPHESPVDIVGQRFGAMIVLGYASEASAYHRRSYWRIRCDCGKELDKKWKSIRDGKRCGGCTPIKHGHARRTAKSSEWMSWCAMIERCRNPSNKDFANYGGRGIKVCKRWMDFENFLADMGRRPEAKLTIERVDNDLGYEPGNCIWATQKAQTRNMRTTLKIEYQGKTLPLATVAELVGLTKTCLTQRIFKLGWSVEQSVTTPRLEYGIRRPR